MYCDRDDCNDPDCQPDEYEIAYWADGGQIRPHDPHAYTTPDKRRQLRDARYNAWRSMMERTQQFIDATRKVELELASREPFDYSPADPAQMEQQITRVQLEAEQFVSSFSTSLYSVGKYEHTMMEDAVRNEVQHHLAAHVYGQKQKPIQVTNSIEVTAWIDHHEPASWWQHLRMRLGWTYHTVNNDQEIIVPVTLTVEATPFSAFPELPYHPPKDWGPRIDMMLPGRISWSSTDPRMTL